MAVSREQLSINFNYFPVLVVGSLVVLGLVFVVVVFVVVLLLF